MVVGSFVGLVIIILLIILILQIQKNRVEEQKDETIQSLVDHQVSLKALTSGAPSLVDGDAIAQQAQSRASMRAQAIDSHIRRSSRSFMPAPQGSAALLSQSRPSATNTSRLALPGSHRSSVIGPMSQDALRRGSSVVPPASQQQMMT